MYGYQIMNRTKYILCLAVACLLALAACNNGGKSASHTSAMQHGDQMQSLQLLVNQALVTAAHGANLKLDGNRQGQALLAEASGLLRRAMSGPEMAMMHKGDNGMPAGMQRTHAVGDAAFDLLGLMMALTPDTVNASQLRRLNERLAIAASGSTMLLQSESASDFKPAMQKHARTLLLQASQSFAGIKGKGAYHMLVGRLIEMLAADTHQAPDKS